MSSVPLDRPTIEIHLKRAHERRGQIEQLGQSKRQQLASLTQQVKQLEVDIERVAGALECSGLEIRELEGDLKRLEALAEAARQKAEDSKVTEAETPPSAATAT